MKLTNPFSRSLTIATGQKAKGGETVDVDDPEVAASLLEQGWREAKQAKPIKPDTPEEG